MITVLITLEDNTTITAEVDHIRFRREEGAVLVDGRLQSNNQSRFTLLGWKGMSDFNDFRSDAQSEVIA